MIVFGSEVFDYKITFYRMEMSSKILLSCFTSSQTLDNNVSVREYNHDTVLTSTRVMQNNLV